MKHIICLFVVLKATEDRRASKRKDSVTMCIQLFQGYRLKEAVTSIILSLCYSIND